MRDDTDPDVFLSEFNYADELSEWSKVVSNERLTIIILDALHSEKYATVKIKMITNPDLCLEE